MEKHSPRELIPIKADEFKKIAKRCGIKYRNKIPEKKLKEMLGYCPANNSRGVEISIDAKNWEEYESLHFP